MQSCGLHTVKVLDTLIIETKARKTCLKQLNAGWLPEQIALLINKLITVCFTL